MSRDKIIAKGAESKIP